MPLFHRTEASPGAQSRPVVLPGMRAEFVNLIDDIVFVGSPGGAPMPLRDLLLGSFDQ